MATKEITIKLIFDPKSNRLIFAEASKDFVDFLIFLLSLPIGTVINLLTSESMVGSIGNIYTSVANLKETNLQPDINKNALLNPMVFSSLPENPLSITESSIISSEKFYTCMSPKCKRNITNIYEGAVCSDCCKKMNKEISFRSAIGTTVTASSDEGFVKEMGYIIYDDLSVTSISTTSIISMMKRFDVFETEEMKVNVGTKEALELLKASFQSTTVLTDVFLKTKKEEEQEQGPKSKEQVDSKQKRFYSPSPSVKKSASASAASKKKPTNKRKAIKDLNKPKKPTTPFFVFLEEFCKTYYERHPKNKSSREAGIAAGERWRQMSEAEKAPYHVESDKRKAHYEKELEAYYKKKILADGAGDEEDESVKATPEVNNEDDDEDESDDCVIVSVKRKCGRACWEDHMKVEEE